MMMQYGQCWGGSMPPEAGVQGMAQMPPVICPTQYRCHDQFIPQEVPFIHPIVNVNRQHMVAVPRHYYTERTETVMGEPIFPGPGSQVGGFAPPFGRRRRFFR